MIILINNKNKDIFKICFHLYLIDLQTNTFFITCIKAI